LPSSYGPNARVRFWDVYGNAIALESIGIAPGAISFNVSALAPGFYFFEIGQGGGMVKGRFLKE
jgi:hypothetical protein